MDEPRFDETASFLKVELEAYRNAMIESRLQDKDELQKLGDTDFTNFDVKTKEFEKMDSEALFDRMINNFWARLPGGFYRDLFVKNLNEHLVPLDKAQRDIGCVHELDSLVNSSGLAAEAQRIVSKDVQQNQSEKRAVLQKLYCEMRKRGYSRQELTS